MEKSGPLMSSETNRLCDNEHPAAAVMKTLYSPGESPSGATIVNAELFVPPLVSVMLGGLNDPSRGRNKAESTMVPVRPFMLVIVMLTLVDEPEVSVVLLGLATIPKSAGPARGDARREC